MQQLHFSYGGHSQYVICLAWSPDGHWIASGSSDGSIHVWNAQTGALRAQMIMERTIKQLAWSPQDDVLAFIFHDSSIVLFWDLNVDQMRESIQDFDCWDQGLAWSPDGASLAVTGQEKGLIFRIQDQERIVEIGTGSTPSAVAWSPDGALIAWTGHRGFDTKSRLYLWNTEIKSYAWRTIEGNKGTLALAFSSDSRFLASAGTSATVIIRETQTGNIVGVYRGHPTGKRSEFPQYHHPRRRVFRVTTYIWSLDWSPNGMYIASLSSDVSGEQNNPQANVVHIWKASNGECVQVHREDHSGTRGIVQWSPDGCFLAIAGKHVNIWQVNS